jgi:hypothetical protein
VLTENLCRLNPPPRGASPFRVSRTHPGGEPAPPPPSPAKARAIKHTRPRLRLAPTPQKERWGGGGSGGVLGGSFARIKKGVGKCGLGKEANFEGGGGPQLGLRSGGIVQHPPITDGKKMRLGEMKRVVRAPLPHYGGGGAFFFRCFSTPAPFL